ncbi:MAG: SLC13 family permease [Chloroflexi bacterium]|nr:SLC13 family permease [Chloroflexota bacterium]
MTLEIGILLLILLIALLLFSFERVPADITALGIMLALILAGVLSPAEAFSGFGSDAVIMILGLLVLTQALVNTGVVDRVGRAIMRKTGSESNRLLWVVMLSVATLSSFMSNTAATAFFVPITLGLAQQAKTSPSRLLMPLAFASILASSVTLIGTSTNIVISGLMVQRGLEPLGMFELTPVGLPIMLAGLAYMLTLGWRLIPIRETADGPEQPFAIQPYLSEISIQPGSAFIGKSIGESGLGEDHDLTVLRVIRKRNRFLAPRATLRLRAGDTLLVEAPLEEIDRLGQTLGLAVRGHVAVSDPSLQSEDVRLVEAVILQGSPFVRRTLRRLRLRERYGLQVLGIRRHGQTILRKISDTRMFVGDELLIQGDPETVEALEQENAFRVLSAVPTRRTNERNAPKAIAIFVGVILVTALDLLPLPVAVMVGVLLAFVSRAITSEEAYRDIDWRAIILIGCMLSLGTAMEVTGAAQFLATLIVQFTGTTDPKWLLSGFFALSLFLTQPMSNQAAAVVTVPIAMQTAFQLGYNPRAFAVMIALGASCSFLTPLEPSCLMVYGPGNYRFIDFFKVGSILTVLVYLIAILLVPLVWPI